MHVPQPAVESPQPAEPQPAPPESAGYRLKKVLLGRALRTSEQHEEKIRKRIALAVFSSDPISSTAYATEEMLLTLLVAGTAAMSLALPTSLAIVGLLAVLILSYRQIITGYSSSGGAYVVTRDNFGATLSQVAGAALVIDYVMTVAVSVSSGTAALTSAIEELQPYRVPIAVGFVLVLTWGNLRGIREAGRLFAIPTYVYVTVLGGLVLYGGYQIVFGGLGPIDYSGPASAELATATGAAVAPITLFLVLHGFSSGTTALTGVEAISNGVSAFRAPQAANAKRTLVAMGLIMAFLFVGVTFLAVRLEAQPFAHGNPTLLAQIAQHVLGDGFMFLLVQLSTLFILVLAANTSYSSFPLLASFAATDAILPRQLRRRGHRLAYSNGIITLTIAALVLLIGFQADTHLLIPLYAIGVVTSFTLAQLSMARHLWVQRGRGWRRSFVICAVGAAVTGVVLVILVTTRFVDGAWMVVIAIPGLVLLLRRVQATYAREEKFLQFGVQERLAPLKPRHEVLVFVDHLDRAVVEALQYARQLNPLSITAVHFTVDPDATRMLTGRWARVDIPIPLEVVDCPDRNLLACAKATVAEHLRSDTELTVLVPKRGYTLWWRRLLHDRTSAGLVRVLGHMDGVNVTLVPFRVDGQGLLTSTPAD